MLERPTLDERRSGGDRRTGNERREAHLDCLTARILRSINRDRRTDENRRHSPERRRFEKVVARMRQLSGELARLSRSREDG
jgi:hypothetical protein